MTYSSAVPGSANLAESSDADSQPALLNANNKIKQSDQRLRSLVADISNWQLFIAGIIALCLTGFRWNVAIVGWIAFVPFLLASLRVRHWRDGLLLLVAMTIGVTLQVSKIISDPIPLSMAFMIGIPSGISMAGMFLLWGFWVRRLGENWAIPLFIALLMLAEWVSMMSAPTGAWGLSVNSQLDNLALLQLASIGGAPLIGGVMAWVSSAIALSLFTQQRKKIAYFLIPALLALVFALAWGSWRLDNLAMGNTLKVAGVVRQTSHSAGLPGAAFSADHADELFERTERAAQQGAKLVSWSEGARLINPDQEAPLRDKGSTLARKYGFDFVMAYAVLVSSKPKLYDNKYVWFAPDGSSLEVYRKHFPAPGEPSMQGTDAVKVLQRPWGKAAGAICYDYDFPLLAQQHARAGAGLLVVPASDWRGIDPYHTQMIRLRAIEGGFSVIRSVQDATSMMFDQYGRQLVSMGVQTPSDGVMSGFIPTQQIATLYSRFGDWPAYVSGVFLVFAAFQVWCKRKYRAW